MDRTTIKDIARVAGVSPGAVSFALNDKPGVSDSTRARVKAVAKDLGWRPNVAARALSANRAGAVGLVIARDDRSFAGEGFFLHLIAGMEEILTPALPWCCSWSHHVRRNARSIVNGGRSDGLTVWS